MPKTFGGNLLHIIPPRRNRPGACALLMRDAAVVFEQLNDGRAIFRRCIIFVL